MKKGEFLRWFKPILVLSFACSFAFTAAAQNYYPADIGNFWVLESSDGIEQTTYTLEESETDDGEKRILLKIETEEVSTGEAETDHYFLSVDSDTIMLHRIILEDAVATLTADFPISVTFFPLQLELGDKWQIVADAEAKLAVGLTIDGKSTTDFEVVGFEDVVTPVGTFQNCAKVKLTLHLTAGGFLNLGSETYQWFAPDVGPVQYQNSDLLIFSLISSNVLVDTPEEPDVVEEDPMPEPTPQEEVILEPPTEEVTPEAPPEEEPIPEPVPYDVTGDGVVNILDLTFVATRFGESDSDADVTGDGTVNILDLVLIAQNFSN